MSSIDFATHSYLSNQRWNELLTASGHKTITLSKTRLTPVVELYPTTGVHPMAENWRLSLRLGLETANIGQRLGESTTSTAIGI